MLLERIIVDKSAIRCHMRKNVHTERSANNQKTVILSTDLNTTVFLDELSINMNISKEKILTNVSVKCTSIGKGKRINAPPLEFQSKNTEDNYKDMNSRNGSLISCSQLLHMVPL